MSKYAESFTFEEISESLIKQGILTKDGVEEYQKNKAFYDKIGNAIIEEYKTIAINKDELNKLKEGVK